MIDLQRSMGCIWNIDQIRMQYPGENSDAAAPELPISRGNSLFPAPAENFIRADLS
jgi:hypothetical protein